MLIWWIARSLLKLDVERMRIEEERDRFFTLSADMMGVASFEGFFLHVNPAWEVVLGYTPKEMTSRPWIEFVHPDDVAATVAEGKKLMLGAVTLFFENRYRCRDGSYRWLSWTAVPVVAEQRLYAVARDMTDRRAAEEQLRDTNQRLAQVLESELEAQQALRTAQSTMVQTEKLAGLGQMVAGVAHEINNPLSFVSNNVAVLQRDLRGIVKLLDLYGQADPIIEQANPALTDQIKLVSKEMDFGYTLRNLQQLLERSREGLKRIQQIVKDLRDFARLDESDLGEVNLNDGIQSTVNIIHGHAKKRGICIKTDLADLPKVTCYPAKINQVVMNLLTNAIDASHDNGEVIIRTRVNDDASVRIELCDTGAGIDPAIREHIFDPFFTTKPPGQGTGLGLSISYGIIRDHNGKIDVQKRGGERIDVYGDASHPWLQELAARCLWRVFIAQRAQRHGARRGRRLNSFSVDSVPPCSLRHRDSDCQKPVYSSASTSTTCVPAYLRSNCRSSSGSKGFVRYSAAPAAKPFSPRIFVIKRREHDDRHIMGLVFVFDPPAHFPPADIRQHQVEYDQAWDMIANLIKSRAPVVGRDIMEAGKLDVCADKPVDFRIVFHHQDVAVSPLLAVAGHHSVASMAFEHIMLRCIGSK